MNGKFMLGLFLGALIGIATVLLGANASLWVIPSNTNTVCEKICCTHDVTGDSTKCWMTLKTMDSATCKKMPMSCTTGKKDRCKAHNLESNTKPEVRGDSIK